MAATLCARLRGAEDLFFPVARYVVLWIILVSGHRRNHL